MKKHNQNGFTAIEGLLIVIILAIIGGTGYYVWNAKQQTDKTLDSAQNEAAAVKASSGSQKYLVITQWGVKVPVSSNVDTSDIYYTIENGTGGTDTNPQAVFASKRLAQLVPNCNPGNGGYTPFGGIEQMTLTSYQAALKDSNTSGVTTANTAKFGSYYYDWQGVRANCSETTYDSGDAALKASIDNLPSDHFPSNDSMLNILKKLQAE